MVKRRKCTHVLSHITHTLSPTHSHTQSQTYTHTDAKPLVFKRRRGRHTLTAAASSSAAAISHPDEIVSWIKLVKKQRRLEAAAGNEEAGSRRKTGRACFARLNLPPPDIHAEHKYHSLAVMCQRNPDGWGSLEPLLRPHAHAHAHAHTHTHARSCEHPHTCTHIQL